eukprot:11862759-Heterocapsa_arctica.AAC.1
MCSTWYVLSQFKPSRRSIERVAGKIGHARTFRPCMRGSFGTIYKFLQDLRTDGVSRTALPVDVWWQLMEAAFLLPLAQLDLGAPWSG